MIKLLLFVLLVGSIVGPAGWVGSGDFACPVGTTGVTLQNAIASLEKTSDLAIKLATTLAGVGAALLLGIKQGMALSGANRILLMVASVAFANSTLFAVAWRWAIANSWFNECLAAIQTELLQRAYLVHVLFFIGGTVCLSALLFIAAFSSPPTNNDANANDKPSAEENRQIQEKKREENERVRIANEKARVAAEERRVAKPTDEIVLQEPGGVAP